MSFHWALIVSQGLPSGLVDLYQIRNDADEAGNDTGEWRLDHKSNIELAQMPRFVGCVLLPPVETDFVRESLDPFIKQYTAKGPANFGVRWTCARWVLVALEDLVEMGFFKITLSSEDDAVYSKVLAKGMLLGVGSGEVINGVRVIDLL